MICIPSWIPIAAILSLVAVGMIILAWRIDKFGR